MQMGLDSADRTSQIGKARRLRDRNQARLRRSTLVNLRWAAVAGQLMSVIIVVGVLGFSLPLTPTLFVIGASALLNLGVSFLLPLDRRVSNLEALVQLGFDIVQLAAMLWLTGGLSNPFALLLLAPVVTSATTLRAEVALSIGGLTAILSLALLKFSAPLPWYPGESFELPLIFLFGVWIALMVGMSFTSLYTWRAARETRRMSDALAATEAVLAHEQKLAALGGLAAAAAHELGTPLATIQVTAKEMARELPKESHLADDANLVVEQARRCRDILQQLARRGDEGDAHYDSLSLQDLLDEVAEPFIGFEKEIKITVLPPNEEELDLSLRRQAEMLYGLTNFVENAVDFATERVIIDARWDDETVYVDILDDGTGFDPAIRSRLGEPYVTSRGEKSESAGGMGLGFFIAQTLLERTGAEVSFGNRRKQRGAFVRVRWPRVRIELRDKF